MHKNKYPKQNTTKRITVIILIAVIFVAATATLVYVIRQNSDSTSTTPSNSDAQTTSLAPSAQDDFTTGEEREPGNTLKEDRGTAILRDTGGSTNEEPNTKDPISSDTGEITAYSPARNSSIESGVAVTGVSKLSRVSFRLVDSVSGVISTGELRVVDGKFSGNLEFNTNATEGRIDLFGKRSDGTEYSNIKLPVRFK